MTSNERADLVLGDEIEVEVGAVAHGGHFVARHEGRVIFVRHTLPGERVRVRITEGREGDRYLRADAVEVIVSSPDRVEAPCRYAGAGRCGGCDFQHVSLAAQRGLKAAVVREQFARLAKLDVDVAVEPVAGDQDGLGWRTRVEFAVDADGRAGLRRHRGHTVIPLDACLIAHPVVASSGVLQRDWSGERAVDVVAPSGSAGPVVVPVPSGDASAPVVVERVEAGSWTGEFEVSSRGFWQVHPGAAATFTAAVLEGLEPQPGERAVDLYAGVGLFAAALADAVGEAGAVLAVESDHWAMEAAGRNLADRPWVELRATRVDRALRPLVRQRITTDVAVLDPPRSGAGKVVIADLAALRARRIAYVACDPAALARDTAYLREQGYHLHSLRAFDAFPMTHHLECVAIFELSEEGPRD